MLQEITSLAQLMWADGQILRTMQSIPRDALIRAIHIGFDTKKMEPFQAAGMVSFAMRYGAPPGRGVAPLPDQRTFDQLTILVTHYLLAEPSTFGDPDVASGILPTMLRLLANQLPFAAADAMRHGRAVILYHELPATLTAKKGVPSFDFEASFRALHGFEIKDYLAVGFVLYTGTHQRHTVDRSYFDKAKQQGFQLPDDAVITRIIDDLSGDADCFKREFAQYKQDDRRYAAYDFNPLYVHPVLRPWRQPKWVPAREDRLAVPLPSILLWRLSTGIYYKMRLAHEEFRSYFGHLFEAYVGRILEHSMPAGSTLLTERDIRRFHKTDKGKVPDFVVINGDRAVLLECKATQFTRIALAKGHPDTIEQNLQQIRAGLGQMDEFYRACLDGRVDCPELKQCTSYQAAVVTFEPFYLINSSIFQSEVTSLQGVSQTLPWYVFVVDDLELLQPHLASGIALADVLTELHNSSMHAVVNRLSQETGKTVKDTFLYRDGTKKLFDWLGFPDVGAGTPALAGPLRSVHS